MSGETYYWQGGRKIEIEHADNQAVIRSRDLESAEASARRAGVTLRRPAEVAPGFVQFECEANRDEVMTALRKENVVHHVYRPKGNPDDIVLITDSFFLKFKEDTQPEAVREYLRRESLVIEEQLDAHTYLVSVTDQTGRNAIRASNSAAQHDSVEYAEPNLMRQLVRFSTIPVDSLFGNQWHLHAPAAGFELAKGAGIGAAEAWDLTLGRREVVVAVADDGFDLTHPDFDGQDKIAGRINVAPAGNTIATDENVLPRAGDYHGTPCAGVAVAESNGTGTVGVAPGCALLAVRFPLNISDAQMALMFELISARADVVSCSWGYGPANAPMSTALRDKIAQLASSGGRRNKGLVFCVAAGNNNCPIKDLNNTTPYEYVDDSGQRRAYSGPIDRWIAAHPDVITVSACTSEKKRSAYSSWGDEINVCAPSNNFDDLRRFDPPGRGIWTTDNEGFGPRSDFTPGSRFTGDFGGTSSATPTVAGVCGLVISRNPGLTGAQVRDIVERTASDDLLIESATSVNVAGGFVDGFSRWFGHGKVDAAAAVAAALPEGPGTIDYFAEDVPIAIPDTASPITSTIEVAEDLEIDEVRVAVKIKHTFIGDLRVDLIAPDGTAVNLHNHAGFNTHDIDRTYASGDTPVLAALLGSRTKGTWTLRVVDTWSWDQGTLVEWRLGAKVSTPQPLIPRGRRQLGKSAAAESKQRARATAKP